MSIVQLYSIPNQTSKHPPYSRSLESWYGWVGECRITRKSRSEDVAAVKSMVWFEALYVERWLQGKGPSKAKVKALGRQWTFESKDLRRQRRKPLEGKWPPTGKDPRRQRLFEDKGKGPWKGKVLGRYRPLEGKDLRMQRQWHCEGKTKGSSKAKALPRQRQRPLEGKGP